MGRVVGASVGGGAAEDETAAEEEMKLENTVNTVIRRLLKR